MDNVVSIRIEPDSLILQMGTTFQLRAIVEPETAINKSVTWSVSPVDIAVIETNGRINATSPGNATITVVAEDGGASDTIPLTVTTYTEAIYTGKLRCVSLDDITFVHGIGGHGHDG